MKEQIKKHSDTLARVATLLKEEKTADAVAALEEATTEVAAIAEEAEKVEETATAQATELEATKEESVKKDATIAKYASLNVSTEDLPSLLEELSSVKTMLTGVTEVMKSVAKQEDIASVSTRLDAIEKAAITRQSQEEERKEIAKKAGIIPGLDLNPSGK